MGLPLCGLGFKGVRLSGGLRGVLLESLEPDMMPWSGHKSPEIAGPQSLLLCLALSFMFLHTDCKL